MSLGRISISGIKFNRNEFSGAFGDIGTDLPLIIGMLLASDFNAANVLVLFGAMQIITGVIYKIPMAVQPLKVVAMLVITQKISGDIVVLGGMLIGIFMLILSFFGILSAIEKVIPKTVIRGIQMGLGMQLAFTALKDYIQSDGISGYIIAFICFVFVLIFIGSKRYPPALFVIGFGILYMFSINFSELSFQFHPPVFKSYFFNIENIWTAFALLTLPQIPLSLGNSIFATSQLGKDYFPEKKITVKKIGITYSMMNILSALGGGIPVCHGSGGLAGQYTFGGRTGGAPIIYGSFYIIMGIIFNNDFVSIIKQFPLPVLGVILLFEGLALIMLVKDIITDRTQFLIAATVALIAVGIPYGYVVGVFIGITLYYLKDKLFLKHFGKKEN